jgi:hypothetical protein
MYFKAVSQDQKHQMMTPYVQVDKRQNSAKDKYIKDPHRIGYFDYNSNLYGYYVFDPEKDFVENDLSKSITRKIKRTVLGHFDPFTSLFSFFFEILSNGFDEIVNINNDHDHEFLDNMVPLFMSSMMQFNSEDAFTSFLSEDFDRSYSPAIGFHVLFIKKAHCHNLHQESNNITLSNFLSSKNILSNQPDAFPISYFGFVIFKLRIMIKSLMLISTIVLLIHVLRCYKYLLLYFMLILDTSWVIKLIITVLVLGDTFAEILLTRHKGCVRYRYELYLYSMMFLNYYSIKDYGNNYAPLWLYLIFVTKRAADYLLTISILADQFMSLSNTVTSLSALSGNTHAEVLYLFLDHSTQNEE